MKINATSYFAGIGTVVAALTIGFGGALLIAGPNQKSENQNRLQQVMSHAHTSTPQVVRAEKLAVSEVPPSSSSQPLPLVQPPPELTLPTKQDESAATKTKPAESPRVLSHEPKVNRSTIREAEVQRAVEREDQRKWAERKKRQEIEAATIAVIRMLRDNRVRHVVQVENSGPARFGFFGGDD